MTTTPAPPRYKSLRVFKKPRPTLADRFAAFYELDPDTGCWTWKGATRIGGDDHRTDQEVRQPYGAIWVDAIQRTRGAHIVSYQLHVGPIRRGNVIMHLCDNTVCVCPDHLSQGTPEENAQDRERKGRGRWKVSADEGSTPGGEAEVAAFDEW